MRRGTRRLPTLVGFLVVLTSLPFAAPVAAVSTTLVINEVDYDQPSTDAAEFLELKNVSSGNVALSGYTVQLVNGANGTVYDTIALAGTLAAGDYFVICANAATVANCDLDDGPNTNFIQNGSPDAVALRQGTTLIDAVSYEGDTAAPYTEGSGAGLDDTAAPDTSESISRCADGADTDANNADFALRPSTPGATNDCATEPPPEEDCDDPYTPIYEIQGSGSSAAVTGEVTTQGVVVGDFEGSITVGLQGFFLQDAAGDGNAATSDGIFVFAGNTDNGLSAGDVVRVSGNAGESFGQTQVSASSIVDCELTASVAPVDVTLPVTATSDFERYEGMLVRFPQELVIAEYFNYDRFGELVLALPLAGEVRPFTPTSVEEPGPDAQARLLANQLRRITLDDGLGSQNPSFTRHPNGAEFTLTNRFRGGDIVQNAVGALSFSFGLYRIQPTAPADYTAVNLRPAAPDPVGGNLQVAAFNMLNFFLTLDTTASDSGPGPCGGNEDLDCRGADANQPDEFDRQRDKLLAALAGLDAEVIGVNEIENTPGVDPLGDPDRGIVAGLNEMLGAGTYDYIDTGVIGTDAIRVGMIYKPGAVTPVGDFEILDSTDDPRFNDDRSRPMLTQTFRENASGAVFTVAVNHLKSKGSACEGDPDTGDGQGNCNVTRTLAAQAIVDWLATDPTGSGDPDFLVIGDLNSYAKEDPIDAVRAGADGLFGTGDDYTNLIELYGGTYAYSYVFDGMAGYLDHALANNSMTAQVTGAADWHINADEPDLLDYDTSFKSTAQDALYEPNAYRSSDHDPVLVGLALTPDAGKVTGSGSWADGSFDISVQFNPSGDLPTGSTTVSVAAGTLVSDGYEWLSANGPRATFQGTGSFDGASGYGFLVSVSDGGSPGSKDRIRVRIWDPLGETVYDSQPGAAVSAMPTAPLTSGNLKVHKVK